MLEAGINIVYIRDFLGHEDISTTMVYVKTDNRLKNEVINKLTPKVVNEGKLPDWGKDKEIMDFLNSLD
ncbi:tyrosine-type recombinase/integrase [Schaedlerella arabinosiphila]|jgi:integrase/recombinase XerD|uniref:Tyrosine-type recombinase/integrase n=1 Tax=Schaedlerella arabinosiphila TaxID=2044587 RepID=A0A9X5C8T9_9FIRM|nr:tyrosine-type recombinase/integrase [Schaedlerella arabinosiphila]